MYFKTGIGYFIKNGKKISRFDLPIGEHEVPLGIEVVEVNNREDFEKIVLDKSQAQLDFESNQAKRNSLRQSAFDKLNKLGLTEDEINSIIGV